MSISPVQDYSKAMTPVDHVALGPELLMSVVEMLKKDTYSRYQDLLKEALANPTCCNNVIRPAASRSYGALSLFIPRDCLATGEERYAIYYSDVIDRLFESPLKTVVLTIAAKISECNFHELISLIFQFFPRFCQEFVINYLF